MQLLRNITIWGLLLIASVELQAQELSNWRVVEWAEGRGIQLLDTLPVVVESVEVSRLKDGAIVAKQTYDVRFSSIYWKREVKDSIRVKYRVLPAWLVTTTQHLDSTKLVFQHKDKAISYDPFAQENQRLLEYDGLQYQGSFSRGLTFGNNQDLALNSRFNMQMAGELRDGIKIRAAITDENLPIQAQGNTQQLREFDKIFIELSKGGSQLIAGDFEVRNSASYFMQYYKKGQGALVANTTQLNDKWKLASNASFAVSRGQYFRNNLATVEGNQGPYRLQGNQGERFIIVLSGTEKVWWDGQLLTRGEDHDYVIDYNLGEIIFTNKRLITTEARIIIEYEYADRRYFRSLYTIGSRLESENTNVYVQVYNEQDSKTTTADLNLTNEDKLQLSLAGDDESRMIRSTVRSLEEFAPERVSYIQIDTLINCGGNSELIQLLRYTRDEEATLFTAQFSNVGQGNGEYVEATDVVANERVFRWVGRDAVTCQPLGDFAPIAQLVAPQKKQLVVVGAQQKIGKLGGVDMELSLSNKDLNRFSSINNDDNRGWGLYSRLYNTWETNSPWQFTTEAIVEVKNQHFIALNPYRNPEFNRDWNVANTSSFTEVLGKAKLGVDYDKRGGLIYTLGLLSQEDNYSGMRHQVDANYKNKGWEVNSNSSLLTTNGDTTTTVFVRPNLQLSKAINEQWTIATFGEQEKNSQTITTVDTLSAASFYFNRYGGSLSHKSKKENVFALEYFQRVDYLPKLAKFEEHTVSNNFIASGQTKWGSSLTLGGQFTYRELKGNNLSTAETQTGNTALGRVNIGFAPKSWKGAFRLNTTYQLGSGQEPKVELVYTEVPTGTGTHIWLDSLYNNDGVIQPFEMEIAPFQDQANYILIRNVTNDFIRTDNVSILQSLDLNPKSLWFKKKGLKKVLTKFSTRSSVRIDRKTQQSDEVQAWNVYQLDIANDALVALSSIINNTIYFNRGNRVFDAHIGQKDNRRRFAQTTGFEFRNNSEWFAHARVNLSKKLTLIGDYNQGKNHNGSEVATNKNYLIHYYTITPSISYLPSKVVKLESNISWRSDKNTATDALENATQIKLELNVNYRSSGKTDIQAGVSYIDITFEGNTNTPAGFAILNGLQKGQNIIWRLDMNQQLSKLIQLNLGYEGRKTGENRVIHTGRAQIRAVF